MADLLRLDNLVFDNVHFPFFSFEFFIGKITDRKWQIIEVEHPISLFHLINRYSFMPSTSPRNKSKVQAKCSFHVQLSLRIMIIERIDLNKTRKARWLIKFKSEGAFWPFINVQLSSPTVSGNRWTLLTLKYGRKNRSTTTTAFACLKTIWVWLKCPRCWLLIPVLTWHRVMLHAIWSGLIVFQRPDWHHFGFDE